ncbi:hypothetical protein Hypma_016380 [Hypsizygus marmoreus]|uniref:Transforming growth factor beta regulator 1 n=1 Tax=Hypsizygus marmoreus TaxID=39966 RepID=A0A369J149_HYPMA|nr:hypothetical protein Hypma_016380 [Hypsizygus marmoreus]
MSRRRSTSSAMGPPTDRDVVMGPPSIPPPGTTAQPKAKDSQEISEKYRKLKRRFFELEEKHKETSTELQRSGERNVKMREERNILLDRIIELENETQPLRANGRSSASPPTLGQPSSSAFPRTLLNARTRTSFAANLRPANAEDDADDDVDPMLSSRHLGSEAHRHAEDERRDYQEEDGHDTHRRRTRASLPPTGSSYQGKETNYSANGQHLTTYVPSPRYTGPSFEGDMSNHGSPTMPSVGVSGRLRSGHSPSDRMTPPGGYSATASSSSSSRGPSRQSPLPSTQSHPHSYTHPPPPPPPHFHENQNHSPALQHYSHRRPHSLTPDQDDYYTGPPSPQNGMDVDVGDARAPGYDYPSANNSYSLRVSGTSSARDHEHSNRDVDHGSNGSSIEIGHPEGTSSPTYPLRSDASPLPASLSRSSEPVAGSSRREGTKKPRNAKNAAPDNAALHDEYPDPVAVQEQGPARRTRGSTAKRGSSSSTAAPAGRSTRSESAALAAAAAAAVAAEEEAEAKARAQSYAEAENRQAPLPLQLSPASARNPTPPPITKSPILSDHSPPSPPSPIVEPQDAQMEDVSPVSEAAPIQEGKATASRQLDQTSAVPSYEPDRAASAAPTAPTVAENAPTETSRHTSEALAATSLVSDSNIDPALSADSSTSAAKQPHEVKSAPTKEPSPMDNIVKVAEAAIAAQNAANAKAPQGSQGMPTPPSSASPAPKHTQSLASASASTPISASPSSTTFTNPYMITTQMKPSINTMGAVTPSTPNMPMSMALGMNPYAMYYPPGTPVTPNTPTYAHPYANPYYYLAAPMGSSGMYPASPNFVPPSAQRPPSEGQRHTKPKRLKAHTVTSRNFSIPMVPRDKRGKPMLPLNVGIMTVINLGTVCMREHFHTERYIFPVGYEVTRRYLSTVDPAVEVVYHCTILDGGDGPKFQIVPSDVPDRPVIAGTATGAWSSIVKQANAIRNRQHSNSVSGPDFFGLGQNTIKHLIQELPNADRLRDYVWQTFVEGGPLGGRHAAVIPALPEEYDASLPIGAYQFTQDKLKRDATSTPESPRGLAHYPQHIIAQAEAQRAQQQALQQASKGESSGQQQQLKGVSQAPVQQSVGGPPTGSESMGYQDYHHGAGRTIRQAPVGGSAGGAAPGPSHSQNGGHLQAQGQHSYLPDGGAPASSTSPSVPATFASIMNAYPTQGAAGPSE